MLAKIFRKGAMRYLMLEKNVPKRGHEIFNLEINLFYKGAMNGPRRAMKYLIVILIVDKNLPKRGHEIFYLIKTNPKGAMRLLKNNLMAPFGKILASIKYLMAPFG